ncbi:MAG TPA: hypothetical protein ENH82_01380 [bacterium]|nr:hypothetical protein [bacterium]
MNQEYDLMEINPVLEDKVYAIADEVIDILKELSRENNKQICGKTLGEKMFMKTTVKSLLETTNNYEAEYDVAVEQTRKISNIIQDKLTELVPSSMTNKISVLKEQLHNKPIPEHSTAWIDLPLYYKAL